MLGPGIIARSLSLAFITDSHGRTWQYHSRSDRHSKVACWAILFDALRHSKILREQVASGELSFGINHEMREFTTNRKKKLDVVVCTPSSRGLVGRTETFAGLMGQYGVSLTADERIELDRLPQWQRAPVGAVRLALEAKAAMTAHIRAIPRLFDELNSSHQTIHATSDVAVAGGFLMLNTSPTFVSPDLNKRGDSVETEISRNDLHGPSRILERYARYRAVPGLARSGLTPSASC